MLCMHRNANGGPYSMPVHLRLTSVLGDSVYDTLPDWGGGQVGVLAHHLAALGSPP